MSRVSALPALAGSAFPPAALLRPRGRLPLTFCCLPRSDWDMPPEMTAIPKKLKEGGYATHMVYVSPPLLRRSRAEHV